MKGIFLGQRFSQNWHQLSRIQLLIFHLKWTHNLHEHPCYGNALWWDLILLPFWQFFLSIDYIYLMSFTAYSPNYWSAFHTCKLNFIWWSKFWFLTMLLPDFDLFLPNNTFPFDMISSTSKWFDSSFASYSFDAITSMCLSIQSFTDRHIL